MTIIKSLKRLKGILKRANHNLPDIGAVVYRRAGGQLSILIFKDKQGYWSVPRTPARDGESAEGVITSFIAERIGPIELNIWQNLGEFGLADPKRPKKKPLILQLFLMQAVADSEQPPALHAKDVLWLPASEASDKIDYEEVVRIVSLASAKIKRAQI